jgi:DNA oxidative demethylase
MDLLDNASEPLLNIAEGAILLRCFALQNQAQLLLDLKHILSVSPLYNMVTPGGYTMSVAMTNCGDLGWVSDNKGYRYTALDANTGAPWQAMPPSFLMLAKQAAASAGYARFVPDACLINQYKTGAKMGLHQDKDEHDFSQPIVSVSLGLPATFLFGGLKRSDKPSKILLQHGDVIVWGGKSRLNYHGIMPLKVSNLQINGQAVPTLEMLVQYRFNLTFRKAG